MMSYSLMTSGVCSGLCSLPDNCSGTVLLQQIHSVTMGSPLTSVVMNFYMEKSEKAAEAKLLISTLL